MKRKPRWRALPLVLATGGGLLSLLGCAGLFYLVFVGVERQSVVMPAMTIDVVDEDGAAVPGADVIIEHRTEPHARLEERSSRQTDDAGRVVTALEVATERVMPLCMHGVPEHRYFVCVDHPGARPVVLEVRGSEAPVAVTVPLRRDPSRSHTCADDLDRMLLTSRTERPDIPRDATHVMRAREP